jgi:hypothetical protein
MELRPQLIPLVFDDALIARLARLADRLDGQSRTNAHAMMSWPSLTVSPVRPCR